MSRTPRCSRAARGAGVALAAAGIALAALAAGCGDGERKVAPRARLAAPVDTQVVVDSTGLQMLIVGPRSSPAPQEVRPRAGAGDPNARDAFRLVAPEAARAAMLAAAVPWYVLDVRSAEEYVSGHLPRSVLVDLDRLEENLPDLHVRTDQVVLVVASGTPRARAAAEILAAHGFPHVRVLQGGYPAWQAAGLPVEAAP